MQRRVLIPLENTKTNGGFTMKMMKKVLAALLACLIVMSMAACAAKSDQTAKPDTAQTDADQPVPNAEDTQTPNAEAGDAPVSNDEADLTSWILEPDTNMAGAVRFWIPFKGEQGMDAMIAAFNEVYPNITVELNTYNNNAEGNMAVNTSIMAGEVDVLASFEISQAYTRWQNGMYMDLTDKLSADGIDLVANWGTDNYKYDNKVYSLPCGGISYYVAINKTAWDEAGLGEIPTAWTWDEYLAASEAMTQKDASGKTTRYGGSNFHVIGDILNVVYQVNGKNRFYNEDGTSSFNSDLVKETVARNIKAENEDGIWFPLVTYRADNNKTWFTYMDGTVASTVINNIPRFIRDTEKYPLDFITTFAPYPTVEAGQTNYMSGVNYFSFAGITNGCQDEAAAWAFLKWYSTYGSKYLALAGHQSTWRGTQADDLVALTFGSEENAAKIIDVEAYKRVVGATENPSAIDTDTTAYTEVSAIWDEYVMYAYNGQMTIDEALDEAATQANAAIKAAK